MRVTLADVAREAQTSTAVVSYVVNNGPRPVAVGTRERVLKAIAKLDYSPDRVARALRRRRSGLIGLVVPDVALPFFGSLARLIETAVSARGGLLITSNTNFDGETEEKASRALIDAGVDGLMILSEGQNRTTSNLAARAGLNTVWLHQEPETLPATVIKSDHHAAARIAAHHLVVEHGRKRLAFIGSSDRGTLRQRYEGFVVGAGNGWHTLVSTDLTPENAFRAVKDAVDQEELDGIVVGTYGQASATLRALAECGLRVPEDIAVVGFDGDIQSQYAPLILTSVEQDIEGIASHAADHLLNPNAPKGGITVFPVRLVLGETCGCSPTTGK